MLLVDIVDRRCSGTLRMDIEEGCFCIGIVCVGLVWTNTECVDIFEFRVIVEYEEIREK